MNIRSKLTLGAAVLAACAFAGPASASLMVVSGAEGTGVNAIDAPCTNPTGAPGTTIFGCLNTDHSQQVQYTSTDSIFFAAGGQAKISPSTSTFDNLTISLVGKTFSDMNINIETGANGSVTFTDNFGDTPVTESLSKNGNNFFTISGADFSWIKFTSTVNATDIKQIRFSGVSTPGGGGGGGGGNPPPPVPEPGTLMLLGAALAGLGGLKLRRTR